MGTPATSCCCPPSWKNLLGRMPRARICVLNHSTTEASCRQEVALARRFSLPQVLGAMRRSEVLIFGGGSLLQDVTSSKSLFYYLALLRMARLCGCKTMLYGNGIGPLRTSFSRRMTARVLRHVNVITLRDPDSMRLLHALGIPDERVTLTADEVFTALHEPLPRLACLPQRPYLAVSLRSWPKNDVCFEDKLADILDQTADKYQLDVLFVPFQKKSDAGICRDVSRRMKHASRVFEGDSAQVLSAVTNARAVLGMRLHALIFATAAGVPSIGIVYDQKVSAFYEMLEESRTVDCEQLDQALLLQHLEAILQDDSAGTAHRQGCGTPQAKRPSKFRRRPGAAGGGSPMTDAKQKKILGVDYGDTRTGLALSDELLMLAHEAGVITERNSERAADAVVRAAKENGAGCIVLGFPKNMDGSQGPRAQKTLAFKELLEQRFDGEVILRDERNTTVSATHILNPRQRPGQKAQGRD